MIEIDGEQFPPAPQDPPVALVAFVYHLLHTCGIEQVETALAVAKVPRPMMPNRHISAWALEISERLTERIN